ncbi:MAG: hypothetical protein D3924_08280 [Candidatus Electrothrix sp. AR4]|nr:hypothetical protein [Candidatus Electrothrix sp. AR4]
MKNKINVIALCCFSLFVASTQVDAQIDIPVTPQVGTQITPQAEAEKSLEIRLKQMQKIMQEKMRGTGGAAWTPTEWQKALPAITVKQGDKLYEYTFSDLIKADGYLCPGSARAYKALRVALPLLYKDTVPVKGDFKITYAASLCTSMVYNFFMEGFTTKEHLELDRSIKDKSITIKRISTGKKITVTFDPSGIRGHDPVAAQAGDVILHAEDGNGMTLHRAE